MWRVKQLLTRIVSPAVKDQFVRLAAALGPNGANKDGSISKLVSRYKPMGPGRLVRLLVQHLRARTKLTDDQRHAMDRRL